MNGIKKSDFNLRQNLTQGEYESAAFYNGPEDGCTDNHLTELASEFQD